MDEENNLALVMGWIRNVGAADSISDSMLTAYLSRISHSPSSLQYEADGFALDECAVNCTIRCPAQG